MNNSTSLIRRRQHGIRSRPRRPLRLLRLSRGYPRPRRPVQRHDHGVGHGRGHVRRCPTPLQRIIRLLPGRLRLRPHAARVDRPGHAASRAAGHGQDSVRDRLRRHHDARHRRQLGRHHRDRA